MQLMTKTLARQLPPLYATENDSDPMVQCKYFLLSIDWVWYGIEFDGDDTFFGFVIGYEPELGYFSLSALQCIRDKFGVAVARDLNFTPCRLSVLRAQLGR